MSTGEAIGKPKKENAGCNPVSCREGKVKSVYEPSGPSSQCLTPASGA